MHRAHRFQGHIDFPEQRLTLCALQRYQKPIFIQPRHVAADLLLQLLTIKTTVHCNIFKRKYFSCSLRPLKPSLNKARLCMFVYLLVLNLLITVVGQVNKLSAFKRIYLYTTHSLRLIYIRIWCLRKFAFLMRFS